MIIPTVPFSKLSGLCPGSNTPDRAYTAVKEMTEDQVRYALWCAFVVLFGLEESNAPDVLVMAMEHGPNNQPMREALAILARATCPSDELGWVDQAEQSASYKGN